MAYLEGQDVLAGVGPEDCPFCSAATGDDDAGSLVVARGRAAFVLVNRYPYNSGHLMVLPLRHVADYTELEPGEIAEIAAFTQQAMVVLRAVMAPHGFNLGMNQGAASGAGIAGHLHQHVVPRWAGDTNFMPVIAGTKALPEMVSRTRDRLAAAWEEPRE
jgi:ATP adenylyltransferase